MNFIEYILPEMDRRNITAYKVCKDLGMSQQTFSNWKDGKMPALDKAISVILYLGLSADELFGIKEQSNLTTEEKELLEYFRKLPEKEKSRELGRLEAKSEQYQNQERSSSSRTG